MDAERLRALRDREEYFWLDLTDPSADELDQIAEFVTVHPLALEDSREFGQRAKLDDYRRSALLVFYGAEQRDEEMLRLVEVHLHLCPEALVSVSREPLTALDDARRLISGTPAAREGDLVHAVLDALGDSLLNTLEDFDDELDGMLDAVARQPTKENRHQIFAYRRRLAHMRHIVAPQRELLLPGGRLVDAISHVDGDESAPAFRDVHDHLDRATKLLESYREQLAGLFDLYLSEVSLRLNVFMKRLSVVATVFLPLSFLAGFFGMNFGYLQDVIAPAWTFWTFGIALPVIASIGVGLYLRRTRD